MNLFIIRSEKERREYIEWLKKERLPLKIFTQFLDLSRSLDQNAYLFGVIYKIISDYTGHSIQEVHEGYKDLFNIEFSLNPRTFEWELRVKSTTEFFTISMSEYIEKVIADATIHMGLNFPAPNEMFYNEELNFSRIPGYYPQKKSYSYAS